MLATQQKTFKGFRLAEVLVAEMEAFLPQFKKAAGEGATLSDIVRVGLEYAMEKVLDDPLTSHYLIFFG